MPQISLTINHFTWRQVRMKFCFNTWALFLHLWVFPTINTNWISIFTLNCIMICQPHYFFIIVCNIWSYLIYQWSVWMLKGIQRAQRKPYWASWGFQPLNFAENPHHPGGTGCRQLLTNWFTECIHVKRMVQEINEWVIWQDWVWALLGLATNGDWSRTSFIFSLFTFHALVLCLCFKFKSLWKLIE